MSCYLLDFADIYHYHENTRQLKNKMKQNKRNRTCYVRHLNAWNAAYLISYLVFCFKLVKHTQNLSLKNSKTQDLRNM